jgi:hypothetical protein
VCGSQFRDGLSETDNNIHEAYRTPGVNAALEAGGRTFQSLAVLVRVLKLVIGSTCHGSSTASENSLFVSFINYLYN